MAGRVLGRRGRAVARPQFDRPGRRLVLVVVLIRNGELHWCTRVQPQSRRPIELDGERSQAPCRAAVSALQKFPFPEKAWKETAS